MLELHQDWDAKFRGTRATGRFFREPALLTVARAIA
jgi:hypothetical protein